MSLAPEVPRCWYYARERQKVGPHALDELRQFAVAGHLQPSDMLLQEGANRWVPASSVPGLFEREIAPTLDEAPATVVPSTLGTPTVPEPVRPDFPSLVGYEVLEELGRGGMGVVYKARHLKLNRLVALKVIRIGAYAGTQERARFLIEAEAVARLSHPNIVQIYEIVEQECPFFCLEFVDGGSLDRKLAGTSQLPREKA
jgi:serine/threonine protein kinase